MTRILRRPLSSGPVSSVRRGIRRLVSACVSLCLSRRLLIFAENQVWTSEETIMKTKKITTARLLTTLASGAMLMALFLLHPAAVRAQWTTPDSSQNINNTNSGNVGIGTTTPSAKLHVIGGIYSPTVIESGYNNGFRLVVNGPGDSRAAWTYDGGTTTTRLTSVGNVRVSLGSNGINDRLFLDLAGNVGIGTTTPLERLSVLVSDGVTNGVTQVFSVGHTTSGTPSAGMGAALTFRAKRSNGDLATTGYIGGVWEDPTNGTEDGALVFAPVLNSTGYGTERMRITSVGNVGIGTTTPTKPLDVVGDINASGTITGANVKAKYQDVAEWVESSQALIAGTVVIVDSSKSNQVIASTQAYDSSVAGVISAQPGLELGERGEGRVLVATTGRVKVKVDATNGPIKIGDLLVTSDREGFAMKSVPVDVGGVRMHRPGTLIGKALEPLAHGTGEILVLLSMQ